MSDTAYKRTHQPGIFYPASSAKLSHPAELRRPPAEAMSRSQDSGQAGYRVLVNHSTGGSKLFMVPSTPTGGGVQEHPTDVWRKVRESRVTTQAGTALMIRVVYVPSGATVYFDSGLWKLQGVGGMARVVCTWVTAAGVTDTATSSFTLEGESDPDGAEQQGKGAQWAQLKWQQRLMVRPPVTINSFADQADFAEGATLTVEIWLRGGARVLQIGVSEQPIDHVAAAAATDQTFTGSSLGWETDRPQIAARDGATYPEPRYGTHRSMNTAAQQTRTIGPRIAEWSPYSDRSAAVTDVDVAPETTTSATYVRCGPGRNTEWNTNEVGWFVMGTMQAPQNLPSRITGAASIPVRVWARCSYAAPGSAVGIIKFQSSSRSWIELRVDQAAVGSTPTWVTITGDLESSIATDDFWPILQPFWKSDGVEEFRCYGWAVSYGHQAVGLPPGSIAL